MVTIEKEASELEQAVVTEGAEFRGLASNSSAANKEIASEEMLLIPDAVQGVNASVLVDEAIQFTSFVSARPPLEAERSNEHSYCSAAEVQ